MLVDADVSCRRNPVAVLRPSSLDLSVRALTELDPVFFHYRGSSVHQEVSLVCRTSLGSGHANLNGESVLLLCDIAGLGAGMTEAVFAVTPSETIK